MFSEIRPNCGVQKRASFFRLTNRKQTAQSEFLRKSGSQIHRNMTISRDYKAVKLGRSD